MENTGDSVVAAGGDAGSDPWRGLSRYTSARIGLGRAGGSVRTDSLLDFRLSHARARDAVMATFDAAGLERELAARQVDTYPLATMAPDRRTYLLRPDLGRRLDEKSRDRLLAVAPTWGARSLAILVSDGLAAQAAENHAVAVVVALIERLRARDWSVFPVFLVPLARVKLQDEVGEILGARHTLMLLGERPGLGSPDSLGAYLTCRPCAARTDADRNCVSNIRPEGLPPAAAARKLAHLLVESDRLGVSGVALKDTETAEQLPG